MKQTERKNQLLNKIESAYDSTRRLVGKISDKALLGAVALDTMLGNPSITYAQGATESANQYSSGDGIVYLASGVIFTSASIINPYKRFKILFGSLATGSYALGAYLLGK
jgi:hypothetical protein